MWMKNKSISLEVPPKNTLIFCVYTSSSEYSRLLLMRLRWKCFLQPDHYILKLKIIRLYFSPTWHNNIKIPPISAELRNPWALFFSVYPKGGSFWSEYIKMKNFKFNASKHLTLISNDTNLQLTLDREYQNRKLNTLGK